VLGIVLSLLALFISLIALRRAAQIHHEALALKREVKDSNDALAELTEQVPMLSPLPLKVVFRFSLGFEKSFFSNILKATSEELEYLRKLPTIESYDNVAFGFSLVNVTVEDWGSHRRVLLNGREHTSEYLAEKHGRKWEQDWVSLWSRCVLTRMRHVA
jgi:hypothetical protein